MSDCLPRRQRKVILLGAWWSEAGGHGTSDEVSYGALNSRSNRKQDHNQFFCHVFFLTLSVHNILRERCHQMRKTESQSNVRYQSKIYPPTSLLYDAFLNDQLERAFWGKSPCLERQGWHQLSRNAILRFSLKKAAEMLKLYQGCLINICCS